MRKIKRWPQTLVDVSEQALGGGPLFLSPAQAKRFTGKDPWGYPHYEKVRGDIYEHRGRLYRAIPHPWHGGGYVMEEV